MQAVSDVLLYHLISSTSAAIPPLVHRKPWDLSINDELAKGDPVKIGLRFRPESFPI
jgi:hypothetical protein